MMHSIRQQATSRKTKRWGRNHRGQVLLMVALMLPVLCGMMGLAIDVGYFYHLKRRMQTAADAGAMAGAHELKRKNSDSEMTQAALKDAASNGFDGSNGEVITVNRPPTSGSVAGDSDFVEVIISQDAPTYFMRVLNFQSVTVQARAVAGLVDDASACVYVLHPSDAGSFEVNGVSNANFTCGVMVNSNDPGAMEVIPISCLTGSSITIVGGYEGNCVSPDPDTGASPEDDPLADLQPPPYGGCDYTDVQIIGDIATLSPGVYCGGIDIYEGAQVFLNPGEYILHGGGLEVYFSRIEGAGVSFYNTAGPGWEYGTIEIEDSVAQLSAPASGPMAGILFFQDRDSPLVPPDDSNEIRRVSTDSTFDGAIYFPTQGLELEYLGGMAPWTVVIVVRRLEIGDVTLQIDDNFAGSLSALPPIKKATLVE